MFRLRPRNVALKIFIGNIIYCKFFMTSKKLFEIHVLISNTKAVIFGNILRCEFADYSVCTVGQAC